MIRLPTLKESNVLGFCKQYLAAERITALRIHCGRCTRGKYWLNLAPAGTPDLLLQTPGGRPVINPWTRLEETDHVARIAWIETKAPAGKLTDDQRRFQRACQEAAALYWVIRTPEDLRYYIPPRGEFDFRRERP